MSAQFELFPPAASTIAPKVDAIVYALLTLCGLVLFLVLFLIIAFGTKYHASRRDVNRRQGEAGRTAIELGWIFAPLVIFMGFFAWGSVIFFRMHQPPEGSTEIYAVGKQWMWKFQHPDGYRELNELHVPVGKPVRLVMTSQDVIHSFFVPAFRVKQDVLPGRYTYAWFEASRPGTFHLFCSQFCGTSHAQMAGSVVAMTPAEFAQWQNTRDAGFLTHQVAPSLASRGRDLFYHRACFACHIEQANRLAPDLSGLYGSKVELSDHTTIIADENYLRESILNPNAKIVARYQPIMPSFEGQLSEDELAALIAFLKSFKKQEAPTP